MSNYEILLRGRFLYRGIEVQQHPDVGVVFERLFAATSPARILEIGTANGGLTLLLKDILNRLGLEKTKIITWDIDSRGRDNLQSITECSGIDCRIENVFESEWNGLLSEKHHEMMSLIQDDGVTIILCDGGNKPKEVSLLSSLMKHGDVIMAHDYSPSPTLFYKTSSEEKASQNLWCWLEITDEMISVPSDVEPYMKDDFGMVAWLCMRRN